MDIRALKPAEFQAAAALRIDCWNHDYAGIVPQDTLTLEREVEQLASWHNNRDRSHFTILGAWDGTQLAGYVSGAAARSSDSKQGVEVYQLFVNRNYRGRKLSLQLLQRFLQAVQPFRFYEVVVYCFSEADSNGFYRHLDGTVRRHYLHELPGRRVPTDMFVWDIGELAQLLNDRLG